MTIFHHAQEHELHCQCSYCIDVDPNKSVARELERYVEELTTYAVQNLNDEDQNKIYEITTKILLMTRYFPVMELPSKHKRLLESKNN